MAEQKHFNEERVNEAFRRVRNRIRKHYPEEIVSFCINKLNQHPQDTLTHLRNYPPWRLLLLIKWALIYGECLSPFRKRLNSRNIIYLINLMHDFEGSLRLPSEYDNFFLFFRNMAYQQFWLEHEFNMAELARQSLLFGRLEKAHFLQKQFALQYNISLSDFIELAAMLMTRFTIEKQKSININWYRSVADRYPYETVKIFLNLLSADFETVRKSVVSRQDTKNIISHEAYQKTPLREIPMLKHRENFYPFSPTLLSRAIETWIYDSLRNINPNDFMNKFGLLFERYVGNCISNTGLCYVTEAELMQNLPGNGKVADFLILYQQRKIFVDAKGVEISYQGMVGHRPEIIEDRLRDSVIKAIKQGFDTARRLHGIVNLNDIEVGHGKNYLIVVTFKDLFLGNGTDFYEYVAKNALDKIICEFGDSIPIPFENMYFISIRDFDLLTGGIASNQIDLIEILEHAVKSDKLPETKKFTFYQHIFDKYPNAKIPQWLIDEAEFIYDCCALRFKTK